MWLIVPEGSISWLFWYVFPHTAVLVFIDKALLCCHGDVPEVAARVITCLRLSSQGTRHSTENAQLLDALLPSEIHPVSLSFLTPPTLASQKKHEMCRASPTAAVRNSSPLPPERGAKLHCRFISRLLESRLSLLPTRQSPLPSSTWAGLSEPLLMKLLYFAYHIPNSRLSRSWDPSLFSFRFLLAFISLRIV